MSNTKKESRVVMISTNKELVLSNVNTNNVLQLGSSVAQMESAISHAVEQFEGLGLTSMGSNGSWHKSSRKYRGMARVAARRHKFSSCRKDCTVEYIPTLVDECICDCGNHFLVLMSPGQEQKTITCDDCKRTIICSCSKSLFGVPILHFEIEENFEGDGRARQGYPQGEVE